MAWYHRFSFIKRRFFVRVWLVVAGSMAVFSLILGWAWRAADNAHSRHAEVENVTLLDEEGRIIRSDTTHVQHLPDGSLVFTVNDTQGGYYPLLTVQLTQHLPDLEEAGWWEWLSPRYSFWWMLALSGIMVMACVFPIAWRLTRRLEALQRNVQRWEKGDLSARVPTSGHDEVTDLTRHLNSAAEHIAALLQAHKTLLATASHELRSPLARIRMAVELADTSGTASRQVARKEILANLNEIDQIVEEILLTSRLEAEGVDLGVIEPVDLIGLLAEECAHTEATLNISPELAAAPGNATVHGVLRLLRRAVRNLLENAKRYGKRPGQEQRVEALIECTASTDAGTGRKVLIHVDDNGPGVPTELRERIFEPFYRQPNASDPDSGFGLGLSLVRSIAQRHDGSVTCSESPSGGARFTLCLPLDAPAA